jgi:hypothetical protein
VTDDKPTDPTPPTVPANPQPTPPANPAEPEPATSTGSGSATTPPQGDGDGPVLQAIGELKDMITGAVQVLTTSVQPDESPAKKPWFARGGKT